MNDCIGFGALNVDMIFKVDKLQSTRIGDLSLEPGGEIFCSEDEFESVLDVLKRNTKFINESPGGSAANTIVALAGMGLKTGYIGRVGKDREGDLLLESMLDVDTSGILRSGLTGRTAVIVDSVGERTIIVMPLSNDELVFEDIDIEYSRQAKFIHVTSFAGEKPTSAQIELVEKVGDSVRISFDPGEIHTQKGLTKMMPVIKSCHILFVTDREIRLLTGEDYADGTRELLSYGPNIVVSKLGKEGSYILTQDDEFHCPAIETDAIDKTGAGDVYAAGFLAGYMTGYSLMRCASLASKAAAHSISDWGRSAYPDKFLLTQGV